MLPAFRGLQSKVVEKLVVIHLLVGLLCVVFVQHFGEEEPEHTRWLSRDGRFVDVFFRQLQVLWCRLGSVSPLRLVQKHQIFVSKGTLFLDEYQRF